MKKVLFIIFALIVVYQSYSQIGISNKLEDFETLGIADKMVGLPKLSYLIIDENTKHYYLSYYNLEYPNLKDIKTISFTAKPDELEYFYNFLLSGFTSENKQSLTIGDASIIIDKVYSSLRVSVTYKDEIPGWFYLSKKQIEKLFGKK